ncbi:hypothetical protein EIP91_008516 [Steccherinum ochraceum]|uniref:Uncharacterized protein n=1 Tax=Steccherinum ochraceum TaxID=92696 RepID=A0A4R0R8E7_9APHY|nr:hypothetical protein EIP91_008516 [Steccherinum ochraceum]
MSIDSRSSTPDSQSSLRDATATIDDLTRALADFSRVRSPEPIEVATCCCEKEDCEASKAWAVYKTKLESRLVLSAEVGQALLERHEAYVRRHEASRQEADSAGQNVDERIEELMRQNANLEKRLAQALMHSEVAEASNQSSLIELKSARENLTRLTAKHARTIGLDDRFTIVMQEKDDLQQERDSAAERARLAELRLLSSTEKCFKLQAQVNRLREDMEMQRSHRQELSEEILTDARQRLQQLQQLNLGPATSMDDTEVTKVLESLVADNEVLKRDNAELQNILTETREDLRTLQEEVDERRANDGVSIRHRHTSSLASLAYDDRSPTSPTFRSMNTASSRRRTSSSRAAMDKRSISMERPHRVFEPLTPETDRHSDGKRTSFTPFSLQAGDEEHDEEPTSPQAIRPLLLLKRNKGVQTDSTNRDPASATASLLGPSPVPRGFGGSVSYSSAHEGQSDSSSIAEGQSSVLGILLERVAIITNRLISADALTLTNRLKRQHLHGADVSHISRNTVSGVLQELNTLRTLFRGFLEDEKLKTSCTRQDLRGLFKIFKDLLSEAGQLRVTLNDVILDPTIAGKISDMAMHPSKTNIATSPSTSETPATTNTPAWIAPLSKLLGLPTAASPDQDPASRALSPPMRPNSRGRSRPPPRIVPKREAALAATSTTVNVEFTGAGAGRVAARTAAVSPSILAPSTVSSPSSAPSQSQSPAAPSVAGSSRALMDIFAGAPKPAPEANDPWIVIPKPQRPPVVRPPALTASTSASSSTVGRMPLRHFSSTAQFDGETAASSRTVGRGSASRKALSRVVDAMIDRDVPASPPRRKDPNGNHDEDADEERDVVNDTLLERTLRPRGLSDSSIHTTFMDHRGEESNTSAEHGSSRTTSDNSSASGGDGGRRSVLQALSRRVQSFRIASAAFASTAVSSTAAAGPSRPHTPVNALPPATSSSATTALTTTSPDLPKINNLSSPPSTQLQRSASPSAASSSGLFPSLSSWAAAAAGTLEEGPPSLSGVPTPGPYTFMTTPKDDDMMSRGWGRDREI